MKSKLFAKVLFGILWLHVLVTDLFCWGEEVVCCKKLTNLKACKGITAAFAGYTKENLKKGCLNVTATQPCRGNSGERAEQLGPVASPTKMWEKPQKKDQEKRKIRIGAFVPFLKYDRFGVYKAMKMAIEHINSRSDILINYTLVLDAKDSASGSGVKTTAAFFQFLNKKDRPVILLGPSTREGVETIAEAAMLWKLVQVSYALDSQNTDRKLSYPNSYLAATSSSFNTKANVAFIKYHGWKRVAILYEIASKFLQTVPTLRNELEKNNISIIAAEGFEKGTDVSFQMDKLKSLDAKIIIGEFSYFGARNVFCQAFAKKMFGPNYVWITNREFHPDILFKLRSSSKSNNTCTSDELRQAADRYISTIKNSFRRNNNRTFSGMTSKIIRKQVGSKPKGKQLTDAAVYAYDSAWVIALALNGCLADGMTFQNLKARSNKEVKLIRKWIDKTFFQGITGLIRFKDNELAGNILIKQNRGGDMINIGRIFPSPNKLKLTIFEHERHRIWKDNKPPTDHSDTEHMFMVIPLPLIVGMWLIAGIGVACSLGFLYFNIRNKESKIIKMSSPNLNNIIVLGCILCYLSVILYGLDARFLSAGGYSKICNIRTAVLSIGYSLSFGAMFSKTWRVYKIFTAGASLKKVAIKDRHLIVIVAGLLVADIIFFSCWIAIDPSYTDMLIIEEKIRRQPDVIIIPVLYQCTCRHQTHFLGVLFAYKGLLLLFGLFLAWETRNVTIPALNDSKYIGISVYNVVVLSIIGAVVSLTFSGSTHYQTPYAILSMCLILCTTLTLLLVFVPKIYHFHNKNQVATQTIRGHCHGNLDLTEGQTPQFKCKATQTDCSDVPKNAAKEGASMSDKIPHEIHNKYM